MLAWLSPAEWRTLRWMKGSPRKRERDASHRPPQIPGQCLCPLPVTSSGGTTRHAPDPHLPVQMGEASRPWPRGWREPKPLSLGTTSCSSHLCPASRVTKLFSREAREASWWVGAHPHSLAFLTASQHRWAPAPHSGPPSQCLLRPRRSLYLVPYLPPHLLPSPPSGR